MKRDVIEEAHSHGEYTERQAIVEWLRSTRLVNAEKIAAKIERGDHRVG